MLWVGFHKQIETCCLNSLNAHEEFDPELLKSRFCLCFQPISDHFQPRGIFLFQTLLQNMPEIKSIEINTVYTATKQAWILGQ